MMIKTHVVAHRQAKHGTHHFQKLSQLLVAVLLTFGATHVMAQPAHTGHAATTGVGGLIGYQAEMHAQMSKMNSDMTSAPMSGNPDLDFAMMMIPHHQGAIDMAKTQLKYGKDEKLRKMAQKIIDAQEKEIEELKERINDLQKSGSGSSSAASSNSGNASSERKDDKKD